jgi:hypothetical protein
MNSKFKNHIVFFAVVLYISVIMAVTVSVSKAQHRFDDGYKPKVTIAGLDNIGKLKLNDWQYIDVANGINNLFPDNRTDPTAEIIVRDVYRPTWISNHFGVGVNGSGDLLNSPDGATGWLGAIMDGDLSLVKCSIEAKASSTNLTSGISLQHSSDPVIDFDQPEAIHAVVFGQNGRGHIRELGVQIVGSGFLYSVGDKVIIEHTGGANGIVRYYMVKSDDKTMRLMRRTRSKLTETPTAVALVYFPGSQLDELFVYADDEATVSFENIGVLEDFQDWENDVELVSTGETLEKADKNKQFTFPNPKRALRVVNATREVVPKEERAEFIAFFEWHNIDKPFIYVDNARPDSWLTDEKLEYWAKFASGFKDRMRGSCLSAHGAAIVEDFRRDIIAKADVVYPTAPFIFDSFTGGGVWQLECYPAVSAIGVSYYEWQVKPTAGAYGASQIDNTTHTFTGLIVSDNYTARVRAVDYEGNLSGWSDEVSITISL